MGLPQQNNNTAQSGDAALRVADLVPMRRLLDSNSLVVRVDHNGAIVGYEQLASLFVSDTVRSLLAGENRREFERVCAQVARSHRRAVFATSDENEVLLAPVLDDHSDECLFVVCWGREARAATAASATVPSLRDMRPSEVAAQYRMFEDGPNPLLETSPWWTLPSGQSIELWPIADKIVALGMASTVMATLLHAAADELLRVDNDEINLRIAIPHVEFLAGVLPALHGTLRSSRLDGCRLTFAVSATDAVESDLVPLLTHIKAMGVRVELVGLDALTASLHNVSDSSTYNHEIPTRSVQLIGEWSKDLDIAVSAAASLASAS